MNGFVIRNGVHMSRKKSEKDNKYKHIAMCLYNNTEEKYLSNDDAAKAKQCIAFEELGVICELRNALISVTSMRVAIAFLEKTGFNCDDLYIIEEIIDRSEITYIVGHMNNDKVFKIITSTDIRAEYTVPKGLSLEGMTHQEVKDAMEVEYEGDVILQL